MVLCSVGEFINLERGHYMEHVNININIKLILVCSSSMYKHNL